MKKTLVSSCALLLLAAFTPAEAADGTGPTVLPAGGSEIPALNGFVPEAEPMSCSLVWANAEDDHADNFPSGPVTIDVLANDAPGVELRYVGQPSHGTTTISGPTTITYDPDIPWTGTDSFTYAVTGCLQCYYGWCSEPDLDSATVTVDVHFIE